MAVIYLILIIMDTSRDILAEEYDKMVGDTGDYYHENFINPRVLDLLGKVSKKKILDLACGQGYFARMLERKGAIVTGCDLSKKLIELAESHKTKDKSSIQYDICSAEKLPYPKKLFDIVVCNLAVHDMDNIVTVFGECSRVLKSGGSFVFSAPHPMTTFHEKFTDDQGPGIKIRIYSTPTKNKREKFKNTWIFHRPLEYYLNTLFDNGFLLSGFREVSYNREIPSIVIIKAIKQ